MTVASGERGGVNLATATGVFEVGEEGSWTLVEWWCPTATSVLRTMSRSTIRGRFLSGVALCWIVASPAVSSAQSRTSSAIRGRVVDQGGLPLVGATARVVHRDTGASRTALTNANGAFLVLLLAPGGPYDVEVDYIGFAAAGAEGLVLQVGETHVLDLVMREQALEIEGLDVSVERAAIFNRGQIGPATRLTEQTLSSMPIMSRDAMELAVLSPLVKRTESGGFSIAGQNDRYNSVLVDGLASKDQFGLTAAGVPGGQAGAKLIPIDAIAQYEVLIAPFDVRLSGFTGGVLNAVTRAGTNDWRLRIAGVRRDEVLIGDLVLPTGPVEASGVDRNLVAVSLGGPIKRDQGHFFVSGEFERRRQPPVGFNAGRDAASLVRISDESFGVVRGLFESLGVDPGSEAVYPLSQSLSNIFARSDWSFGNGDRVTIRNVFAQASNDESANRTGFLQYGLSSNGVSRNSTSNITSAQWFADFGALGANELDVTVQRSTDRSSPLVDWAQVEVDVPSSIDGQGYRRELRAGSNFFAQHNDLEQTNLRITNSLDLQRGDGVLTVGVSGSYNDIRHTYLPGANGEYRYASLQDFANNAPERYQRGELAAGVADAVRFDVLELGGFVQREIHAGKGLTMRFGLRLDAPFVFSRPASNIDIRTFFGYDTSNLPSGNLLLSPRWGFNWQSSGERLTQVRGGFGVFAGQVPYVWLANAFHHDGLRSVTKLCTGRVTDDPLQGNTAPPPGLQTLPDRCEHGEFQELRSVVVFSDDFRYPLDLKFSAGVDREISDRVSGSLTFLFSRAVNQVSVQDLNVDAGTGGFPSIGSDQRRYFSRLDPKQTQVLLVTNDGEDWGASLSAELRGGVGDRVQFQLGYAMARSWDRMSLVYADMHSNYGLNPVEFDPKAPPLRTSNFDRPHKIVGALFGHPFSSLPNTELSILYSGQSGLPFTFVYGGHDVNGDGYPGLGLASDRYNDAFYVPRSPSDGPYGIVSQFLLAAALRDFECLAEHKGEVLPRNACRAPWENQLDVRVAHSFDTRGVEVRLEADLINVLNIVNSNWGSVRRVPSVVPLVDACGRVPGCVPPVATWGGAVLPTRSDQGALRPAEPWNVVSPDSQWQMQFGLRLTFSQGH